MPTPTVIKAGQTRRLAARLHTVDLADHLAEALAVVDQARADAQRIVIEARAQARSIRAQAGAQGRAEGFERGLGEGRRAGRERALSEAHDRFEAEHAAVVQTMSQAVQDLEECKRDLLIRAGRDVLAFAVACAERLTRAIGRCNSQAAVANVERALLLVGRSTDVTCRVSPQDAETIRRFAGELTAQIDAARHLCIVEDDALAPGGCIVSTPETQIDASLETQIDQLVTVLLGRRPEGQTA